LLDFFFNHLLEIIARKHKVKGVSIDTPFFT